MLCMRAFRASLLPNRPPPVCSPTQSCNTCFLKPATPAFTKFETSRRLAHQLLTKGPTAAQARLGCYPRHPASSVRLRTYHLLPRPPCCMPPSCASCRVPRAACPSAYTCCHLGACLSTRCPRVHRHGVLLSLQARGPVRTLRTVRDPLVPATRSNSTFIA